jgi:hypothetical protein
MTDLDGFAIGDGDFVVYDRDNYLAWIQTAEAVALEDCV